MGPYPWCLQENLGTMKLQDLLNAARRFNASDIHVVVGLPPMFRVNGEIITAKGEEMTADEARRLVYEELNDQQQQRLEETWQLCYSHCFGNGERARVTVYFRNGAPELAIRMSQPVIETREELRLPAVVDDFARRPNGLVVITGPAGSGKTTTLHYMIDLINQERRAKIVMIEDPIEFTHPCKRSIVIQQEVLTDVKSFRAALVHVLRQDPDVIGIGEMRDSETIHTALTAAETGHLVLATLHTSSVTDLAQRLISAFPEAQQSEICHMLANTLQGVIAQMLLPKSAGDGRILAAEVLLGIHSVRHQVRENAMYKLYSEMQAGAKHGMKTMDRALLELYEAGEITYDIAISAARYPQDLKERMA